ncbi:hypothetical protein M758_8G107200 [Ceratodon purpureus]|uniref:Dirigent protein n=1 Tax=Ceratodon purpureus TaxID=3225 RepID=A0A8T0GXE4_CERPU|nr:hypothetical protein KC19_8G110600 [Ceratodon purpureus]KAG0608454.1 hypothetical protein M758_8G107200 [Ceratodon purpureus]
MAVSMKYSLAAVLLVVMISASHTHARLNPKHKTHNVTFYAHEAIETGDDATARIVAGPGGNISALQFGALVVVNNIITETADPNSLALGKLQGLYTLDGSKKYRAEVTIIIDQPGDLVETTYEVVGQRAGFNVTNERELAVLAGTGNYLGQKGYAVVSTVSQTLVPGSIIGAQYNIQKWTLVVGKAD